MGPCARGAHGTHEKYIEEVRAAAEREQKQNSVGAARGIINHRFASSTRQLCVWTLISLNRCSSLGYFSPNRNMHQ
jgi:hypothetical protein